MGLQFLDEFDLVAVGRFRTQWQDGPRSSAKKLERLRAFFRFAQNTKWVQDLELGRAYALQGDTSKSRTAYQDFFTLWKDADPDIPILKEAKAEYAKLQ